MKWVVLGFIWVIVLLCTVVLMTACTGTTRYSSRQLTCLGFCAETEVTHKTDKADKPEDSKPPEKEKAP